MVNIFAAANSLKHYHNVESIEIVAIKIGIRIKSYNQAFRKISVICF